MANKPVTFTTGSLIRVLLDGLHIANAISIGYSVTRGIQAPPILGNYVTPTLVPVSYQPVKVTLSILKTLPQSSINEKVNLANANSALSLDKSEVNANVSTPTSPQLDTAQQGVIGTNQNTINSFDPAKVLLSSTFDLEISRAYPTAEENIVYNTITIIKDCRFDGRSGNISLGQIVREQISMTGTLLINYSPNDPTGTNKDKILEDFYSTDLTSLG
jgi:hypothetical protein